MMEQLGPDINVVTEMWLIVDVDRSLNTARQICIRSGKFLN